MYFYYQGVRYTLPTYPDNVPSYPFPISSYPVDQYALRTHADATSPFGYIEGGLSSNGQQFLSPLPPVVAPPPKIGQASSRPGRSSNAFMIFRSAFVRQHKHIGRRQRELSSLAGCAWRALGTDGQTEWYEKAALAKDKFNQKSGVEAIRRRPNPYRARNVVRADIGRTEATDGPPLFAQYVKPECVENPLSLPTLSARDYVATPRTQTLTSFPALGLHSPSFFAGPYRHQEMTSASPASSIRSDSSHGDRNVLWTSAIHSDFNYDSSPVAAYAAPLAPHGMDSLFVHDVPGFPVPTQYSSSSSPNIWTDRLLEPQYNHISTSPGAAYYSAEGHGQDGFQFL